MIMENLEVLSKYEIVEEQPIFLLIFIISIVVFVVYLLSTILNWFNWYYKYVTFKKYGRKKDFIRSILSSIILFITIIVLILSGSKVEIYTGEYKYKVKVNGDIDYNEFYDNYIIESYDGEFYEIKLKEE